MTAWMEAPVGHRLLHAMSAPGSRPIASTPRSTPEVLLKVIRHRTPGDVNAHR
jgi:hypothetical protein